MRVRGLVVSQVSDNEVGRDNELNRYWPVVLIIAFCEFLSFGHMLARTHMHAQLSPTGSDILHTQVILKRTHKHIIHTKIQIRAALNTRIRKHTIISFLYTINYSF